MVHAAFWLGTRCHNSVAPRQVANKLHERVLMMAKNIRCGPKHSNDTNIEKHTYKLDAAHEPSPWLSSSLWRVSPGLSSSSVQSDTTATRHAATA